MKRSIQSEKLYAVLNNALHYFDFVEFKACRLLQSWMKWKNSNELSPFAWHAALILINSDLWSVEATIIVCDLLRNENDRFRQRAEIILRSQSNDDIRPSSKLGIDVLLALVCYQALIESTAYSLTYNVRQSSAETVAAFIEEHSNLLPIFLVNLYNSIRHFTNKVIHIRTVDFYLAYGYPQYVEAAGLIAVRIPAAFCAYVKDWQDGDNLKRALFYTSKQHIFSQRAACLTILSIFGELTVELCEMFIEALRDDPHMQNTCYKCLARINCIKDEKTVQNMLFFYLKSKSMNVRYVTAKILLHLSKSALIPLNQVQTALKNLILDPSSNENLWLIKDQNDVLAQCMYYYAGSLKDVVYSLLVQHLTGHANETIRRNELNDIATSFAESEQAARFASCLYEAKTEENLRLEQPSKREKLVN
ncbi:unnamed protein product [Rotaria sp. Silwood2]|nr:unnamed protein product [Rotaria sp. Silwood2]